MPMPAYPLYCYTKNCKHEAEYKIAARWSDGLQSELKTYGLVCADCLADWFWTARDKHKRCRLAPGETLEPPGVYHLERGLRDQKLQRLTDVEERLLSHAGPADAPSGV
ncbi:MAG: hypothetical protein L0Y72_06450 [Gemmataceae bacterium]|nr:hypothetical protein [Gemmataceae bacterium]MCI0738666.1 hypothetical protein [Gemmataceae bacterium]